LLAACKGDNFRTDCFDNVLRLSLWDSEIRDYVDIDIDITKPLGFQHENVLKSLLELFK